MDFCYSKSLHQSVPVVFVPISKPYLKIFVLEIDFYQLLVHFPKWTCACAAGDRLPPHIKTSSVISSLSGSNWAREVPTVFGCASVASADAWLSGSAAGDMPSVVRLAPFFLSALALAAARHRFRDMGTAYQGHGVLQSLDHIASSALFPLLAPLLRRRRKVIEHGSANELETWVDNRIVMIEK